MTIQDFDTARIAYLHPGYERSDQGNNILSVWIMRYRARKQLRKLPPRILRDMGMEQIEAEIISQKPFWVE